MASDHPALAFAVALEAWEFGAQSVSVAALFVCSKRALLFRRVPTEDKLPTQWELPSGCVERGETVLSNLRRIIDEQTGIDLVAEPHLVRWFDYRDSKGDFSRQLVFLIHLRHELAPTRHPAYDAYQWIDAALVRGVNCRPETLESILDVLPKGH